MITQSRSVRTQIAAMLMSSLLVVAGCSAQDTGSDPTKSPTAHTSVAINIGGSTQLQGATPQESQVTQRNYQYTVAEYLTWVVNDADQAWSAWFSQVGLSEPMVGYQIVDSASSPYVSRCDGGMVVPHDHPNAYYCPADSIVDASGVTYQGVIILPQTTFYNMWSGVIFGRSSGIQGDFAAGGIVAHEFGHHVQDEILQQAGISQEPVGKNSELLADCFAGNWVRSLYERDGLEQGDLTELVAALQVMGDPSVSTNSHGTAQERVVALEAGINTGDPISCMQSYWPQALA